MSKPANLELWFASVTGGRLPATNSCWALLHAIPDESH